MPQQPPSHPSSSNELRNSKPAEPNKSREKKGRKSKKNLSTLPNPNLDYNVGGIPLNRGKNQTPSVEGGTSVSNDVHPMQRWLEEDKKDEPFYGFEGGRPEYAAYCPVGEWNRGHPTSSGSLDVQAPR